MVFADFVWVAVDFAASFVNTLLGHCLSVVCVGVSLFVSCNCRLLSSISYKMMKRGSRVVLLNTSAKCPSVELGRSIAVSY